MSAPAVPPRSPASVPTPRPGQLRDRGAVRHDTIDVARWTVSGTAKVATDATIGDLRLRGLVSVGGRLRAGTVRGEGTLEVAGPIEVAQSLSLKGTLRANAPVHAGSLTIGGTVRAAGPLTIDGTASVTGLLESPSLAAGAAQLVGGARIPGTVAVPTFFARLRETSRFGPIIGRSVVLYGKVPNVVDKVLFHECDVTVDRIEAETVNLEGVDVRFVRAPQVVLGRYCHVTEVEGTIVRQHPSSFVGPESRTPPPYGLRR